MSSKAKTIGTALKKFQEDAIDNATSILKTCLVELGKVRGTATFEASRALIVGDLGAVLFEAPTGSGKTLMAGHVVEKISQLYRSTSLPRVIWFWFAPYNGLIDQAAATIGSEFKSLRPKNPATDRQPEELQSGDVFVTTWAGIATREAVRKTRADREDAPSIDKLIAYARSQGFAIGAVIDEAHHSFNWESQAFAFYRDVLSPELTILATATPRDRDIVAFAEKTSIRNLRRVSVSRRQVVDAGLIKEGVKVAVFKAPTDVESLVDFRKTALHQGVATHRRIKKILKDAGFSVIPLLLVQVDSDDGSIQEIAGWLYEMGFKKGGDNQVVKVHTAAEPDPSLSTIASDESVEVLIFKMAVAIGFDAPRAFTLVSMRPSRDEDFGVQIVGRILRVDRRLQNIESLPLALDFGYVFLSDMADQVGLSGAAQRINAIKAELASVTPNVAVVAMSELESAAQITHGGQTLLFPAFETQSNDGETSELSFAMVDPTDLTTPLRFDQALWAQWGLPEKANRTLGGSEPALSTKHLAFNYPLQEHLGAPRFFRRAMLSLDGDNIVLEVVSRFRFDDDVLLVAQQNATSIIMNETEIFENTKGRPEKISADLAQSEIDDRAQLTLFKADPADVIHLQTLHSALLKQLQVEFERRGIGHLFDTQEKLRDGLHKILALRPKQLKRAVSETVAQHTTTENAAPLPDFMSSDVALDPSRLNLYGVFPGDLNTWERPFADLLDEDLTGTILWWHRNPPRKPYSVGVPLPGQPDFYPDFIVGVKDRLKAGGILLMETKRDINDEARNAAVKAQAFHPDYQRVMMVYWFEKREWRVVEYDATADKNFPDQLFRLEILRSY